MARNLRRWVLGEINGLLQLELRLHIQPRGPTTSAITDSEGDIIGVVTPCAPSSYSAIASAMDSANSRALIGPLATMIRSRRSR